MERVAQDILAAAAPRPRVRFGGKIASAALKVPGRKKKPSVSEAAEAAIKDARIHKITLSLPSGETKEIPGYASRRAATIDAKVLMLRVKKAVARVTGVKPKVVTSRDPSLPQKRRSVPARVEMKEVPGERGYALTASGEGSAAIVNPKRLRRNTHLAVGTKVDYKGKRAVVVRQHPKDKYTIRFASTGGEMISPGFLLQRI
jgi:hypothetical protein